MAFFMTGFGFALVPLYDVFCEVTGLNGKTGDNPVMVNTLQVDTSREIEVEFERRDFEQLRSREQLSFYEQPGEQSSVVA